VAAIRFDGSSLLPLMEGLICFLGELKSGCTLSLHFSLCPMTEEESCCWSSMILSTKRFLPGLVSTLYNALKSLDLFSHCVPSSGLISQLFFSMTFLRFISCALPVQFSVQVCPRPQAGREPPQLPFSLLLVFSPAVVPVTRFTCQRFFA